MNRLFLGALGAVFGLCLLSTTPQTAAAQRKAPPGGAYKKVSTLVALPDFVPGLGRCMSIRRRCPRGRSSPTTIRGSW